MNLINLLVKVGLSREEAKMYLLLFQVGMSSLDKIVIASKKQKSDAKKILDALIKKELVNIVYMNQVPEYNNNAFLCLKQFAGDTAEVKSLAKDLEERYFEDTSKWK
jgi:predicted transcriptional regulator